MKTIGNYVLETTGSMTLSMIVSFGVVGITFLTVISAAAYLILKLEIV